MITVRHSGAAQRNNQVAEQASQNGEGNVQWLRRAGLKNGVLLLGGASLGHFRVRIAQSHLRSDLLPSFWSLAGVLHDGESVFSAPLELGGDAGEVVNRNGTRRASIKEYDDPALYPNIAVLQFAADKVQEELRKRLSTKNSAAIQRSVVDVPSLLVPWLAFCWGAGKQGNPLLGGTSLPSAAFVEALYATGGVDLTPGLAEAVSCPEAIWHAAIWWQDYYQPEESTGQKSTIVPKGRYIIRQPAAAVVEHKVSSAS